MKFFRSFSKFIFFILLAADVLVFGSITYLDNYIGNDFPIINNDRFSITSPLPVTAVYRKATGDKKSSVDLKMFGVIPFSSIEIDRDGRNVAVLGTPFGMKLYTEGVLVAKLTDIETDEGEVCPAKSAGIKTGDYILTAEGKKIATNEELMAIVEKSKGEKIRLTVLRGKKKQEYFVDPVKSTDGSYKIGTWIRDSSAGIGTLTFYSPDLNTVCGLGHGVSDEDTGTLLKLDSGEIVEAEIFSVTKSENGTPGELKGRFLGSSLGKVMLNSNCGVFSSLSGNVELTTMLPVASKREVRSGEAKILCTLSGKTPEYYTCKIDLRNGNYNSKTKNMTVTVTDPKLLEATGGIVQGMSGSPVIQNGRLIGAITHVLVDDPTTGYAIFAENMLETAQSIANSEKLRDAS